MTTERFIRRNYPKIVAILKPDLSQPAVASSVPNLTSAQALPVAAAGLPKTKPTPSQIRKARSLQLQQLAGTQTPVLAPRLTRSELDKQNTQAKRLVIYGKVQELANQGLKRYPIAHQLAIASKRVSRYLKNPPQPVVYTEQPSKLDPYKPYLWRRFFGEGCHNSLQLAREIKAQGYSGGNTILTGYITRLRAITTAPAQLSEKAKEKAKAKEEASKAKAGIFSTARLPSPRQLSWWFFLPKPESVPLEPGLVSDSSKSKGKLSPNQQAQLKQLREQEPELEQGYLLTQHLVKVLNSRDATNLQSWFAACEQAKIAEYESLASGLADDRAAVETGINLPWSQGQTEGQVNKVKLLKRQMYNRASFRLLHQRLLRPA